MWTRRDFVRAMAAGGVAGALPFLSHGASVPDVDLRLVASLDRAPIFPGAETPILRYSGELIAGRDPAEGIVSVGRKGSFLILPGEQVRVAFTPSEAGPFLYHCHNLEHEGGDMMRNVLFKG